MYVVCVQNVMRSNILTMKRKFLKNFIQALGYVQYKYIYSR